MMNLFFVDDASQKTPTREGMGALLAVGGICVPEDSLKDLESQIELVCNEFGFPPGEIFKWSPGRDLWMHQNLVGEKRQKFFIRVLSLTRDKGAIATVILEDIKHKTATGVETPELDLMQLFLERAHHQTPNEYNGMVIVSQPGGDRKSEYKFLADCVEALKCGTDYVKPERIVYVVTSPPKFMRLLQVADVVTSCSTAFVGGENEFSPPVFDTVKQILMRELGRIGGVGLKIHPDFKYANLYHWLLGDSHFIRFMMGLPFPLPDHPYSTGPHIP